MSKPVILTGLRTNAEYHLGNYLGALLPMVELHKAHLGEYQVNLFAPDLHSFTGDTDHAKLYAQTMQNLRVFVASGMPIDHEDFYIYRQSFVSAHSELTVILNNFAYFGELSRMTQFKDKSNDAFTEKIELYEALDKLVENSNAEDIKKIIRIRDKVIEGHTQGLPITVGLFDYPVLMASDILLYGAKYVPLGDDQNQHLELARDLGIRLNNKFGDIFTVPEEWKKQLEFAQRLEGVRIRSLRNPTAKMSKSVDDPSGTIQLSDTPDEAIKKIKTAETDSLGKVNWDWANQPGITNLLQIYQLLTGKTKDEVVAEWAGSERYGDLKSAVADQVASFLTKFQSDLVSVDQAQLDTKLLDSESKMNDVANATLLRVQKAVGLRN